MSVEWELKFQASAAQFTNFWLRPWAPAP